MSQAPQPLIGALALTLAALLWSAFGILVRIIGFDIPLFFASWTRNLAAAIIILVPLILFKKYQPIQPADRKWFWLRSLGGLWGFLGNFYGFYYLPIGTAYFMYFGSTTLVSFLIGKVMFQEKLTPMKALSLVLAAIGIILVYGVSVNADQAGWIWLLLSSGIGGAFWTILPKKIGSEYSPWQVNGLDFLIFSIFGILISVARHEVWSLPTMSMPWLANLLFLLMFIITGQLVITGFKHLDAQRGSLVMLIEIAFGLILGALVFHEQLSMLGWIGGALIVGAAALPELVELRKKHQIRVAV